MVDPASGARELTVRDRPVAQTQPPDLDDLFGLYGFGRAARVIGDRPAART
jgi:hypothetical protein